MWTGERSVHGGGRGAKRARCTRIEAIYQVIYLGYQAERADEQVWLIKGRKKGGLVMRTKWFC